MTTTTSPHTSRREATGADAAERPQGPPLGLPVLAELPELAGTLSALVDADRLQVDAVLGLVALLDTDEDRVAQTTGVGLEHWLGVAGRGPRLERRTWLRTARLLIRLPQLRGQVEAGRVSAAQLRGLTIALRGTPAAIDAELDSWLADAAARLFEIGADPDALIEQARQALSELTDHTERAEDEAGARRYLYLQKRLDGSGGTFTGEEDAYGLAMLEAATTPRSDQHDQDVGTARADNLQTLLHHTCGDHPDDHHSPDDHDRSADDDGQPTAPGDAAAADDARPVVALTDRITGHAGAGRYAPPQLLIRAELSTLLHHDQLPTDLLVRLSGGKLRLTSKAARTLVDAHGARLRLIITDQGTVVGVGRTARVARGWLTDTLRALHDTCTGPLCDRPALGADSDHAVPWEPDDGGPGGTTNVDNLGPLCRSTNRDRAATGWRPAQASDGTRTWTHLRTGLRTTSVPATWRPPSRHPPPSPDEGTVVDRGDDDREDDLPF